MVPASRLSTRPLVLLLAILLAAPAHGQLDDPAPRRVAAGIVLGTILTVDARDVPAHDFFASIERALGFPLRGTWADDAYGHGLDPALPITMRIEDADALFVIELALEQLATWEPCTWQFGRGGIEVGTKERLSNRPITRLYPLTDLMIEPPRFGSDLQQEGGTQEFHDHPYSVASLTRPAEVAFRQVGGMRTTEVRKGPRQLLNELMQAIISFIEPGNWTAPARSEPGDATHDDTPPRNPRRIAFVQASPTGHGVIVKAPDFIHRQIDGVPGPVWPRTADAARRAERTARASSPGCSIEVVHIGAPPKLLEVAP